MSFLHKYVDFATEVSQNKQVPQFEAAEFLQKPHTCPFLINF